MPDPTKYIEQFAPKVMKLIENMCNKALWIF